MAFITDILNTIKNAHKGKDMRQAIYDGIQQCYEDATGHPDSVAAAVKKIGEVSANLSKETADRKAEVNTERKRIDNLIKELPATAGEYQQSKLVLHSYDNAAVKCTTTSGNYTNVPAFTTDQGGPLSSLYTKKSNYQIAVNKSGLYLFELRIHVNSLIANKRVELAPFVNDSRNAALASSYNTAGNFTLTQVAALPLWLSANDTVDFKIAPIDATEVSLQLGDVLVYAIDWEDKFKIPDYTGYTAETKDIRTGADGVVHNTAGEAVRKQIGNLTEDLDYESTMLKNELDDFVDKSNNLFNKESVSDGFYSGTTGKLSINSAYCCVMIPFTYKDTITITGTNYDQCYYDSNKTFIGSSTLKGKALTIDGSTVSGKNPQTNEKLNNNKIRYIGINIEKNEYDLNKYMICRGESLSNSYIEYGVKKIKKDVKIDYTQVDGIPHVTKVYTVGSDGDYTSFTDCLKNLKDVTDEKIIYVKTGVYDIFEELGGSDYINSLDTSNLNWRDVQPIVPINTKIIGQGNVTLKFTPTAEEIKSKDIAFLFSPLNISYATEIDNIKIECTNCRYAIHFETNGLTEYADGESRFRNLICHKKSGTFGNPQVFGSGVGRRNQWEFESCTFMSDMTNIWTTHTNTSKEDDSCIIIFNDCIFANDIESEVTKKWELVQFISGGAKIGHKCKHNYVRMNNCYIGGKVGLSYQGTETGEKQQFDLTMLKCDTQGVSISEKFGENPYIPKIY